TGPVIVLVGFALVLFTLAFAPGRGVAWRAGKLRRDRRRNQSEAVLVDLETSIHAGPPPTEEERRLACGYSRHHLSRALRDGERAGLRIRAGARLFFGESGAAAAHRILGRRDCWTAWLEHGWRLHLDDAPEPDRRGVRRSLGQPAASELLRLSTESR